LAQLQSFNTSESIATELGYLTQVWRKKGSQKGRFSKNKKTPQVFIQSAMCTIFEFARLLKVLGHKQRYGKYGAAFIFPDTVPK